MVAEIGSIVKGKITKITPYGAFVELPNGTKGLIHISQISDQFVRRIEDYLNINDEVEAKVVAINKKGNLDLSIKDLNPKQHSSPHERKEAPQDESFEEKLKKFFKESEERLADLKRSIESKRSSGRYR
jgi:S1 RNA binding domain protein